MKYRPEHIPQTQKKYLKHIFPEFLVMFTVFFVIWGCIYSYAHSFFVPDRMNFTISGNSWKEFPDSAITRFMEGEKIMSRISRLDGNFQDTFEIYAIENESSFGGVLPTGTMELSQGLLDEAQSENSLAWVIAHEAGHIKHQDSRNHLMRMFNCFPLFLYAGGRQWIISGGLYTVLLKAEIPIGKVQERAADLYAIDMLQKLYGHVGGYDTFLSGHLDPEESIFDNFFDEHPRNSVRLAYMREYVQQKGYKIGKVISVQYKPVYPDSDSTDTKEQ